MASKSFRWHIALNTTLLDDALRAQALAGIQKVAPQCVLIQVSAIAASYASLGTKGTALKVNNDAVAAAAAQLLAVTTVRDLSRTAFDVELVTLKTLVEGNALTAADINNMGFVLMLTSKASKMRPDPPVGINVILGNTHGKLRVSAQATGARRSYAAEVSLDGITYSVLTGHGKERVVTGYPSGTKLWFRFATMSWGLQSEWCTPVMATMP